MGPYQENHRSKGRWDIGSPGFQKEKSQHPLMASSLVSTIRPGRAEATLWFRIMVSQNVRAKWEIDNLHFGVP